MATNSTGNSATKTVALPLSMAAQAEQRRKQGGESMSNIIKIAKLANAKRLAERNARLLNGRCPIHGQAFSQIDNFKKLSSGPLKGKHCCVVGCPYPGCRIEGWQAECSGRVVLKGEWKYLLTKQAPNLYPTLNIPAVNILLRLKETHRKGWKRYALSDQFKTDFLNLAEGMPVLTREKN